MRDVILVHGLWAPSAFMAPLAARLRAAGFRCHRFAYLGTRGPLEAHGERLARFARRVGPAHYVGHSLGGLVVLDALERHPALTVGRVVLLGTSARGNFSARRFGRRSWGRWLLGESTPLWTEGRAARWTRPEPLGVIAGTRPFGLGRLFGALPGANDGVVRLEETEIEGCRARLVLHIGHSAMLVSPRVADEIGAFLRDARFTDPR